MVGVHLSEGAPSEIEWAECVINVSEGRDPTRILALVDSAGSAFLDLHSDPEHHRSVITLGGTLPAVEDAARRVIATATELLDLRLHSGVHPRIGVVDVVPFVPLGRGPSDRPPVRIDAAVGHDPTSASSLSCQEARDALATWAADELGLPSFLYGTERTLPFIRKHAFVDLFPDRGPERAHVTAGAMAVGVRPILVAYNLILSGGEALPRAKAIAAELRSPRLRTLGLEVTGGAQVSCNLIDVTVTTPETVFDAVAERLQGTTTQLVGAELVGLVPTSVLDSIARERWAELDLSSDRTIEGRLTGAGTPS